MADLGMGDVGDCTNKCFIVVGDPMNVCAPKERIQGRGLLVEWSGVRLEHWLDLQACKTFLESTFFFYFFNFKRWRVTGQMFLQREVAGEPRTL